GLGMIGSTPGTRRADIVANAGVLLALVGNIYHVGDRRRSSTAGTARTPGIRLPGDESAVFLRAHFHTRVGGRARPGHFQFRIALQHNADRLAAGFLRDLRRSNAPAVRAKLAAEASADMILMQANVGCRKFYLFRHLTGNSRDILSRHMHERSLSIGPSRVRPMLFKPTLAV